MTSFETTISTNNNNSSTDAPGAPPPTAESIARWGINLQSSEEIDDWSSEWQEVLDGKAIWGGRTRGGRGIRTTTGITKDISVEGVTLAFCGKELLQRTSLRLIHNHRYGLVGENGVGKSTLLRRIAKQSLPGIPLHFRIGYVQQEIPLMEDIRVLDYILKANQNSLEEQLEGLKLEEQEIEELMDSTKDNDELAALAERLCEVSEKVEALEAKQAAQIAQHKSTTHLKTSEPPTLTRGDVDALGSHIVSVLDGLGLSKPLKRLSVKLSELSGGWRMRAALAQCLCHLDSIDVLLLDEPTNHLDLPTVAWLQEFLCKTELIILFVSHDRAFLNAVATDIIEMKNHSLNYFRGGYEDWIIHLEEMAARQANLADARQRKEAHIQKTISEAHQRGDDKQAKAKVKKLERAAMTRHIDGHRFKNFSMAKLDEKYLHLAQVTHPIPGMNERYGHLIGPGEPEKEFKYSKFKFPQVDVPSLRLATDTSPLLTMEKCAITYQGRPKNVLENVTLQLTLKSRVGIIGKNGKGKTTLMHALCYGESLGIVKVPNPHESSESSSNDTPLIIKKGSIWKHHNLKIGIVSQHQIDLLSSHLFETPVSYLQKLITNLQCPFYKTELDIRAHLGAFGLSGPLALQQIGSLSGGQKARLSFAIVCLQRPHLLFLDEPSNHLSMDSIESLINACQDFTGGIMIISHNRYLISRICNEVWVVDNGLVQVRKPAVVESSGKEKSGGAGSDDEVDAQSAFDDLLEECIQQILHSS